MLNIMHISLDVPHGWKLSISKWLWHSDAIWHHRADSRLAPSQWEMSLQSNSVSNWVDANLESALASFRILALCERHHRSPVDLLTMHQLCGKCFHVMKSSWVGRFWANFTLYQQDLIKPVSLKCKLKYDTAVSVFKHAEFITYSRRHEHVSFYPRPVLASGYCRCLRPSVSPSVRPSVTKFVRAITHHPFKLGSPNLDHRCKRPWLRSLLFLGVIDLDLQGQI